MTAERMLDIVPEQPGSALKEAPVTTASPTAVQPHEIIWNLTNAVVASRSLHVAAELGVADHIDDCPVAVDELAVACVADPEGLERVLNLLAARGIFERGADGYVHTDASRLL
ncbi:MAG: hypothetical protein ABR564_03565, partial [Candidatus Dormibacteria bacterium]